MTRVFKKEVFDVEHYLVDCQVYDKSRLVFVFRAFVRKNELVEFHAIRCREGYPLLSEQRLFISRLSSIIDGSATVVELNTISTPHGSLLPIFMDDVKPGDIF